MRRIRWAPVVEQAADIVRSYDGGVTLRQLFYRLVAAMFLPNTETAYKALSDRTARARRAGDFPDLIDRGRSISREPSFTSPDDAREWLHDIYRRDRTEGQPFSIYLGGEKTGMLEQGARFGDWGFPIVAVSGYSSQTFADVVAHDARAQGRDAVLLYAGDFDPEGEDIDRDFVHRRACFNHIVSKTQPCGAGHPEGGAHSPTKAPVHDVQTISRIG